VKSKSEFAPAFARHVVPSISAYRPIVFAVQEEDSSLLCALGNSATSPLHKKNLGDPQALSNLYQRGVSRREERKTRRDASLGL
jgi:hypothetical protein